MDPLEETRRRLECQVNEFFSPGTSNERKQQIGTLLENFSKQPGSWKQALHFLSRGESFTNEFLVMYCITVIENSVKGRWFVMAPQEQRDLHLTLYNFLIQHASASSTTRCPNFIRNKIVKILTDVGKFSWPHVYPEFFDNIVYKLMANEDTVVVGIVFLKTISEEWSNCKDEISTDRKFELKVLLIKELQKIFDLLHRKYNKNAFWADTTIISYIGLEILVAGLKHCITKERGGDAQQMNPAFKEILALALETCAHFFTWIPFDGTLMTNIQQSIQKSVPFSKDFITTLCQFAAQDMTGSVEANGIENLAILGINAINEFLYRKYVPKELDEHVNLVTNFAVDFLNNMNSAIRTKSVSSKFLDKGIEYLCLIASTYFFRYEKEASKQFTAVLLSFTFAQTECNFYYECLEIWKLLLDHLLSMSEVPFGKYLSKDELLENFKPVLLDLAIGIVNSTIKFELADNTEYYEDEDDEDTEVNTLTKNVDILVKIGELLPAEALESVTSTWSSSYVYFEMLQSKLDESKTGIVLENQMDVKHFSFVVQLIGRIAEIFYGDVFKHELDRGKSLVNQLVGLMVLSKNFYFVQGSEVLVQANCEIVYAIRTWIYWLGRYFSEVVLAESVPEDTAHFYVLLGITSDVLRFCLDNHASIHPSIVLAHANLFALVVNCIRTKYFFKLPWVQTLIENILSLRNCLQADTYRVLNKSVSIILLLPWQNCTTATQDWELRTRLYNAYMKNFMTEMLAVASNNDIPNLLLSVQVLNDQLDQLQTESGVSKKICWGVCQEVVQFMHKLAPIYIKRPDVSEEILNFFLKVMEVLRQQAGAIFFSETVRIFLGLFTSANIITDLMKDSETSSIVVEKFLKMLEFMIKDPNPTFKKFTPDCLSVALDHIYPVLAQRPSPDVKLVFFQFIRDAVSFRWTYFFSGFLYAAPSASGSPSSVAEEEMEANKRLYQIFETIGHSFLQSDLEIFRFNLNTLTVWNQKHQIYSRLSVDLKMFDGFMSVLLQVLARKSHELLKEEIAFNLYEMSIVDFPRFWQVFLPQTLQKDFSTVTPEQRAALASKFKPKHSQTDIHSFTNVGRVGEKIDSATFTLTLYRFIDDLRFYHFYDECVKS